MLPGNADKTFPAQRMGGGCSCNNKGTIEDVSWAMETEAGFRYNG
jgi:hypothetical protein